MLVNIDDIQIKKRVRKDLGDLNALMDSLRTYGLLNPISITHDHELIAGERRLQAAKQLGWTSINANIIDNISDIEKLEMELEENNQRKDFTREELLEGYERLEKLRNPSILTRILNAIKAFFKKIASLFQRKKI
ncbi:MAG: ParB/RepB/Spo0J family partition protein [Treponema sp.]|nr:ParB/RepB/Spo0J family partition protein [Treponema sp.]MDE6245365.1 ParB/RepB/Spo0J family partition protein [Treponemataceae bacterium]MBD5407151.1 ParB/RepB/Spo0J family partition protein [Treponema sp.]MBD5409402.1 ParB/RepB/Spo0J family partition protein [Treponema sp.]MBD5410309.1 ParB/RepB/Spo0J family partition protein [Treponema sp.]